MATTVQRNVIRCRYKHKWIPEASAKFSAWLKCTVCGARMRITGKR